MSIPPISHCIGDYDKEDAICVGDGGAELPCSWSHRCEALKNYLHKTGKDIERYVVAEAKKMDGEKVLVATPKQGAEGFAEFCDKLILLEEKRKAKKKAKKKYKKKAKKDKMYDKRRDGPTASVKAAAARALRSRARNRRNQLLEMFERFKYDLIGQLQDREFATAGQVVLPGQLFIVDRSSTSGYLSLYCQTAHGWNTPVVSLGLRTASLTFDVYLPTDVEQFRGNTSKATFKKLSPAPIEKNGRFKSTMSKAGKVELALLAEAIATLVNGGIIALPAR